MGDAEVFADCLGFRDGNGHRWCERLMPGGA
jgi:hypothetical protein